MCRNAPHPSLALAIAAVTTVMSCVTGPMPRGDIAIIESGSTHIDRIDRVPVPVNAPYYGCQKPTAELS